MEYERGAGLVEVEISTGDVVIREDLYPRAKPSPQLVARYRQDLEVLPPILLNQHNILIDGRHRLLAHIEEGKQSIAAVVQETVSDGELLALAIRHNAAHGEQLSQDDKRRMALRMYMGVLGKERQELRKRLPGIFSVTDRTIRNWVKAIDDEDKKEREAKILDLWLRCYSQEEIAEAVGDSQRTVGRVSQIGNLSDLTNPPAGFKPQLDDVWQWNDEPEGQVRYPGNSDQRIVENLLYGLTEPGDIVVDPFAGGGSTLDMCRKWGRRCWVSDMTPLPSREQEIRRHDVIADGIPWPLSGQADVKLVYLDPPYWGQAEGWYADSLTNLANLPLDSFHERLAQIIDGYLGKGAKYVALLLMATQWQSPYGPHRPVDHTFEMLKAVKAGMLYRRVAVPYPQGIFTPEMIEWANENRGLLCRTRELAIWQCG